MDVVTLRSPSLPLVDLYPFDTYVSLKIVPVTKIPHKELKNDTRIEDGVQNHMIGQLSTLQSFVIRCDLQLLQPWTLAFPSYVRIRK